MPPSPAISSDDALASLAMLGAHALGHINGDLHQHLRGTCEVLERWQAPRHVCLAGLFHAVYGTAGFSDELLPASRRPDVAGIIGGEAEELVYLFCACDRADFYQRLQRGIRPLELRDRFRGETRTMQPVELAALCELTLANEIEIALHGQGEVRERQAVFAKALLEVMSPHIGERTVREARAAIEALR